MLLSGNREPKKPGPNVGGIGQTPLSRMQSSPASPIRVVIAPLGKNEHSWLAGRNIPIILIGNISISSKFGGPFFMLLS